MKKLLKKLYTALPFKKQLYSLLNHVWTPPRKIYQHLHFKGPFTVNVSNTETFRMYHYGYEIENEVFWRGVQNGWEKISVSLWIRLSRKATVIFDIGANTGVFSLISKAVNPGAKLFAFEPVNRVFKKLRENSELNNFDIFCVEKAASNFTGKATIYDQDAEHTLSVTVNKNMNPAGVTVVPSQIDTISLKEFIEQNNITQIDLIKIDVETHEPEVLEGLGTYLELFQPSLLIEILNDDVGKRVEELVKDLGYLYFNIDENRGIRQVESINQSDYYNYLLCNKNVAQELNLIK